MPGYSRLRLIKGLSLVASAARTATGNSGSINFPVEYLGGEFILDVTAASGTTPTLDIAIQTTDDDGTTWRTHWRFAQATAAGVRNLSTMFAPGFESGVTGQSFERAGLANTGGALFQAAPISDKIRVVWTIGGTNPSFTFVVNFIAFRSPYIQA